MKSVTLAAVLVGSAVVSAAQQPRVQPVAGGTGQIAGVIVDAGPTPRPVRGVIVTLIAPELPAGRAVVSDDQGRFTFDRLPAGRFALTASKPAYLKTAFGAVRPGGAGTPITVTAGQRITDVRLTLPHGGAIAGTIRDARGDPVPGLQVSVIRTDTPAGPPTLRTDTVTTDDLGAYRKFGLLPGTYVVTATTATSGGIGEVGQMSATDVDATIARLRQRPASGGAAASTGRGSSPSSIVRPTEPFTATPIFYPGVVAPSDATVIKLGLSEERTGIDFVYQLARAASVSGSYFGSEPDVNVTVSLWPAAAGFQVPTGIFVGPIPQRDAARGTFRFTNVTPGKYTVMARSGGSRVAPPGAAGAASQATPEKVLYATTTLVITGDDLSGITLSMQPAARISGRLAFEATSLTPPADLTRIRIRLTSMDGTPDPVAASAGLAQPLSAMATLKADGTFVVDGALPGAYVISTVGEPGGWHAKTAMVGGRDLFDVPLEIDANDISGLEITLSDRRSRIDGQLVSSDGAPASGYFVVAFPADRALWLTQSRRMKSVRPSTDGQFRLDDLPAGDYYLAALTDADQEDWREPEFLTRAKAAGVKLTLGDGATITQTLRITR